MGHLCAEDKVTTAVCSCFCHIPPYPLCQAHAEKHENCAAGFHFLLPLEAINEIRDDSRRGEWEHWIGHLKDNFDAIKMQTERFGEYRKQVEAVYMKVVGTAEEKKSELLHLIGVVEGWWIEAAERAMEVTRAHMLGPGLPEDVEGWERRVWGDVLKDTQLVLFQAEMHRDSVLSAFQVSLQFQLPEMSKWSIAPSPPPVSHSDLQAAKARIQELEDLLSSTPEAPPVLPCVTNESVSFFNFKSLNWLSYAKFRSKIKCDERSAYAALNSSEVIVCGGGEPNRVWNNAYLITGGGKVSELPRLAVPRFEHSVVCVDKKVFVLGGRNDTELAIINVEAMQSETLDEWKQAGRLLEGRIQSGVTVWNGEIYLCGGKDSRSIEAFNPITSGNRMLPTLLEEQGFALAFTVDMKLVVLTRSLALKLSLSGESTVTRLSDRESKGSNSIPVVVGDLVFYVAQSWCYWLSASSFRKVGWKRTQTSLF